MKHSQTTSLNWLSRAGGLSRIIRKKTSVEVWCAAISVLFIIGAWSLVARLHLVDPIFLPSPLKTYAAARHLLATGSFQKDILITVLRVVYAFVLSILTAVPLAFWMSRSKTAARLLNPVINFIHYIPVPVLIPLMILTLGIGEASKICILYIGTVFQLILLFAEDIRRIPREYHDLFFTLNFSYKKTLLTEFLIAAPELFNNTRISLALCWSYVVIAEMVSAENGIGSFLKESQRFSNTPNIYVAMFTMAIIGMASDYLLRRTYRKLFPYKG